MYRTARTTPLSRIDLLREADRLGVTRAARNFCVSRNTVYRWRRRRGELADRPCRLRRSPRRTSDAQELAVLALRMERRWGPDRIGPVLGMSRRTAYRVLRRYRAHRLRELFPATPRSFGVFEANVPGEVVQIDIKTVGRLVRGGGHQGWSRSQRQRTRERVRLVAASSGGRRRQPSGLSRGAAFAWGRGLHRLPARRRCAFRCPGDPRPPGAHRQRGRIQAPLRRGLRRDRGALDADPSLPPLDKRTSGTLQPHAPARMPLCGRSLLQR